jgi:hypothetical protein
VRSSTLLAVLHDVARSLIHHGFNRIPLRDRCADRFRQTLYGTLHRHPQRSDGKPPRRDSRMARQRT